MERLLADGRDESSSNEIAPRLSRKRRKTGRFSCDAVEFAGSPTAKRHKTNFTHKDSLPFLFDDGGTKSPHLPWRGRSTREARRVGKAYPLDQCVLRKHPHPSPPPQAGEGAHFHRCYKLNPISSCSSPP
jgi:hypothetical protein